jgi:nucleotide-binding universal stress UspA family protein
MNIVTAAAPVPAHEPDRAQFERVLFGIDFGPASLSAARWATTHIAPRSEVILAHVAPSTAPAREDPEGQLRRREASLAGGLRGFAATLDASSVRNVLRLGSASHWLSTIAADAEASLLVMGRRAHASRTRIGEPNVLERAARRAGTPVLVVPEGTSAAPGHVLAAVDDSAFAPVVLRVARRLARLHSIPLTVLHVLSPAVGAYERVIRTARHAIAGARDIRAPGLARLPVALSERTSQWLSELSRREPVQDQENLDVALGDPAREVAAFATTHAAPLIVIGVRGSDLAPRGSLGSVARELLSRSPVPVLAVQAS